MTRVYVDMTADLFHAGHVAFLKKAKGLGTYLIVGLLSDEDAENYKRRPIISLTERALVVKACRYVDEVISGCPLIPTTRWLDKHSIDLVVHGDDFNPDTIHKYYGDAIDTGRFETVPYSPIISTTEILSRIKKRP